MCDLASKAENPKLQIKPYIIMLLSFLLALSSKLVSGARIFGRSLFEYLFINFLWRSMLALIQAEVSRALVAMTRDHGLQASWGAFRAESGSCAIVCSLNISSGIACFMPW